MKQFSVKKTRKCKLIIQEPGEPIEIQEEYHTRIEQTFGSEQVVNDFVRFSNSNKQAVTEIEKLAANGYYIFCISNINDRNLLAVHMSNVEVI